MLISLFVILLVGTFALQLLACVKGKNVLQRAIPVMVLCVLEVLCWILYFWAMAYMKETFGSTLSAWIAAVIVLFLMAADALAWLIWAIVKLVQKRRK